MSEIQFTINEVKHNLLFGMDAYKIFAENAILVATEKREPSNIESFAVIVYAGLINNAIVERSNRATFKEAYLLTQDIILESEKLQQDIWETWSGSIADNELQKVLGGIKKKVEENIA